jgi:hypothetical protein
VPESRSFRPCPCSPARTARVSARILLVCPPAPCLPRVFMRVFRAPVYCEKNFEKGSPYPTGDPRENDPGQVYMGSGEKPRGKYPGVKYPRILPRGWTPPYVCVCIFTCRSNRRNESVAVDFARRPPHRTRGKLSRASSNMRCHRLNLFGSFSSDVDFYGKNECYFRYYPPWGRCRNFSSDFSPQNFSNTFFVRLVNFWPRIYVAP